MSKKYSEELRMNKVNRWTLLQNEAPRFTRLYLITIIHQKEGKIERYTSVGIYSSIDKEFRTFNLKSDHDWVFSWKDLPPPHHRAIGGL